MTGMMAALEEREFSALQLLLKAPSKDVVQKLCRDSFPRSSIGSGHLIDSVSSSLSITTEEAAQVVQALHALTQHVVYKGLMTAEHILSVFPGDFHQNLKNLLTKIVLDNVSAWRNEAQDTSITTGSEEKALQKDHVPIERFSFYSYSVSLPRLVDLDWRVDVKTSSDSVTRMAVPTCLLQMKIQEDPDLCGLHPATSTLTMELSKETLDTMLDGLGRIRDQLSAVASK